MFKKIFQGGETNFVVVFTSSSQRWIDENMTDIKMEYIGCTRFIGVDFPPPTANEQRNAFYAEDKSVSLSHLENTLDGYGFRLTYPNICHMSTEDLLQHARMTLEHLVRYVVGRFVTNADNPFNETSLLILLFEGIVLLMA